MVTLLVILLSVIVALIIAGIVILTTMPLLGIGLNRSRLMVLFIPAAIVLGLWENLAYHFPKLKKEK